MSYRTPNPFVLLVLVVVVAGQSSMAHALITGGVGNDPLELPNLQAGAAAVLNSKDRVAWWEGPPFGGGQYHAECRGDAKAFNQVLNDFAKIDAKNKEIVVHDGIGASFWLNPNRQANKKVDAKVDWIFMCWAVANWERALQFPARARPGNLGNANDGPPVRLDVYVGGNIDWDEVQLPAGIKVSDERLVTKGFSPDDGAVLVGSVVDLESGKPLIAEVSLESIEPLERGGYAYDSVRQLESDAQGQWATTKVPAGWYRVVVRADGYVPRVVGNLRTQGEPKWNSFPTKLAKPILVAGEVIDGDGRPLPDAQVRITDVELSSGGTYASPTNYETTTDAEGKFEIHDVPAGQASVRTSKKGYCRIGLSPSVTIPTAVLKMQLVKAAQLIVEVDFLGVERPRGYIVNIEPSDGGGVGKWGGSGNINDRNQITFRNVPPGSYVIQGRPNPSRGDRKTKPVTVELIGGETTQLALQAR